MDNDTIFAVASGAGRAAIAVLRLSGPAARNIVESVAGKLPNPRAAALTTFRDPATGGIKSQSVPEAVRAKFNLPPSS